MFGTFTDLRPHLISITTFLEKGDDRFSVLGKSLQIFEDRLAKIIA
jgi:hypothetical protein